MFVDSQGRRLSKNRMIEVWNSATGCGVSGHSARRSGAMQHVRQGLQLHELAFLGRWKSAVVLTYANDALQEVPTNKILVLDRPAPSFEAAKTPWTPIPRTPNPCTRAPMTPGIEVPPELHEGEACMSQSMNRREQQSLWVASNEQRRGRKTCAKL